MLFESLTGQLPFPANTLEQIVVAHMLQPPLQPSELQAGVPAAMDQVIATGMAKEPGERYATTKDLASAARGALTTPSPPGAASPRITAPSTPSITHATQPAEYKQVTVLFADMVHSMDIAASVGAERLREIMIDLVNRCATVVQHFGGTVDKFTGDGIMAVFGAPVALEDHAMRACMAALGVQEDVEAARRRSPRARRRRPSDARRAELRSRWSPVKSARGHSVTPLSVSRSGWLSGWSPPLRPARCCSVRRPPDWLMAQRFSASPSWFGSRVPTNRSPPSDCWAWRHSIVLPGALSRNLVGRRWEMFAVEELLARAVDGHGAVVGFFGAPGIGKSRLVREVCAMAAARDIEVFTAYCESHTSQVPFHTVARLLRAVTGVQGLEPQAARAQIRAQAPDAEPEDLLLFDDLLGIADPDVELPKIDPDARRRRLTALVNAASLARETPAVYVIEDVHWIDEVSESMLAAFLTVIPQTPSLVLVTYRPEYRGVVEQSARCSDHRPCAAE